MGAGLLSDWPHLFAGLVDSLLLSIAGFATSQSHGRVRLVIDCLASLPLHRHTLLPTGRDVADCQNVMGGISFDQHQVRTHPR